MAATTESERREVPSPLKFLLFVLELCCVLGQLKLHTEAHPWSSSNIEYLLDPQEIDTLNRNRRSSDGSVAVADTRRSNNESSKFVTVINGTKKVSSDMPKHEHHHFGGESDEDDNEMSRKTIAIAEDHKNSTAKSYSSDDRFTEALSSSLTGDAHSRSIAEGAGGVSSSMSLSEGGNAESIAIQGFKDADGSSKILHEFSQLLSDDKVESMHNFEDMHNMEDQDESDPEESDQTVFKDALPPPTIPSLSDLEEGDTANLGIQNTRTSASGPSLLQVILGAVAEVANKTGLTYVPSTTSSPRLLG